MKRLKNAIKKILEFIAKSKCNKSKTCKYFSNESATCTKMSGFYYSYTRRCSAYYK